LAGRPAKGTFRRVSPALRFACIYAAQFFAFGILLPFLPAVLAGRGLGASEVGMLLAAGSAIRLVAGPAGGRLADALGRPRLVLALAASGAALAAIGLTLASGVLLLLVVVLLHNAALAPVVPLTDALAVAASRTGAFDYARARAAGSIAFILAALGAGQAVALAGLDAAVWLLVAGLAATALAALLLPGAPRIPSPRRGLSGFLAPLRIPLLRRLLLVSALIQGSHAMYYAFGTLHWQAQGLSAGLIGALWAAGVVAEVALFWYGRGVVTRLGPVGLSVGAALAGVLRWGVLAVSADPWALFPAQLLHAGTFGMQHLAVMAIMARAVPPAEAGTAQALHAALGVGLWMGVFTLACGPLFAALGGAAFWAMAVLCALAVPAALRLRG
jgi:PPP family 3-phenylpropionic acid transporter